MSHWGVSPPTPERQPTPPARLTESAPFSESELGIVDALRQRLGVDAFAALPADVLVASVRGARREADWTGGAEALVQAFLAQGSTTAVYSNPPPRDAIEAAFQAGPVGVDGDGRPIILERVGRAEPRALVELLGADTGDDTLVARHTLYVAEAARALCRAASHRVSRRIFKSVVMLDFRGAGLQHTDASFVKLLRESLSMCSRPETLHALYVLNVPGLVVGVWGLLSQVCVEPLSGPPPGRGRPQPAPRLPPRPRTPTLAPTLAPTRTHRSSSRRSRGRWCCSAARTSSSPSSAHAASSWSPTASPI